MGQESSAAIWVVFLVGPFRAAALLQHATKSDPKERPVLLWVDREAGHGSGKPLSLRIRDVADQRAFLMWQLGMFDSQKK